MKDQITPWDLFAAAVVVGLLAQDKFYPKYGRATLDFITEEAQYAADEMMKWRDTPDAEASK